MSQAAAPARRSASQRLASYVGADALRKSVDIHRARQRRLAAAGGAESSGGGGGDGADPEDEEAANEHRSLASVPLSVSPARLVVLLGRGIAWYFRFFRFVWAANAALTLIGLLVTVPHLVEWSERAPAGRDGFPSALYLSSFSPNLRGLWTFGAVLSVLLTFSLGPAYREVVRRHEQGRRDGSSEYVEDPFEGQYRVETDECVDRIEYETTPPHAERVLRRLVSFGVLCAVVVLQAVLNYYLQRALRARGGNDGSRSAIVLSFVIVGVNMGCSVVTRSLTGFERHLYWSDYRRADVLKIFVFKVANVLTLFFVKSYEVLHNSDSLCPLFLMADQAFWLIIVDVTVTNLQEVAVPALLALARRRQAETSEQSNDAHRPEFNLADEYLELVYRQLIVGLGMLVMPLLPAVALAGNVAEYWLDKYRLLRVSARPKRTDATFAGVIAFFFFVCGAAVLLSYPNGAVWVLSGTAGLDDAARGCAIFR